MPSDFLEAGETPVESRSRTLSGEQQPPVGGLVSQKCPSEDGTVALGGMLVHPEEAYHCLKRGKISPARHGGTRL